MCRHCHNGTGAVAHHHIVGDVDGNLLAGDGVDAGESLDFHAGLVLDQLCPLELALLGALCLIGIQIGDVGDAVPILLDDGVLRCDDHKGHAVQGVRTGGIDAQLLVCVFFHGEVHECAGRLADPVLLLKLDVGQIVHLFQSLKQLVCVLGDAQIPDLLGLLHDFAVADVALTALRILVGQNDLTAGAVVDQCLVTECQSLFEHLQENPLGPLVVVLISGIDHSRPVEREAHTLELSGKLHDVVIGYLAGMYAGLDGGVLRRQTVGIEADGEQHIVALHPALPADNLQTGICFDVAHVHAVSGRVRKFHQRIELRLGVVFLCTERTVFLPILLPLGFHCGKIILVAHVYHSFNYNLLNIFPGL